MLRENFKKTAVAMAVAGAIGAAAPTAQAVNLAADNLGEVLLFPYYTVWDGWQTRFNITNTSADTVVFKIRFREAYNSRDARDFNVVLSPYDVWVASVFLNGTTPRILTPDKSCTGPQLLPITIAGIPQRYVDMTSIGYDGNGKFPYDFGGKDINRTYDGHVEAISMGRSPTPNESNFNTLAYWAYHTIDSDFDGFADTPRNCATVATMLENAVNVSKELWEPNNVLRGSYALINPAAGQAAGGLASHVANCYNPNVNGVDDNSTLDIYAVPGDSNPNLNSCRTGPGNSAQSIVLEDTPGIGPRLVIDTWGPPNNNPVDATTAIFTRSHFLNSWVFDPSTNGFSNWVVNYMTKYAYVDTNEPTFAHPEYPFEESFQGPPAGTPPHTGENTGASCHEISLTIFDREEQRIVPESGGFSPPPKEGPGKNLCYETNVIVFGSQDPESWVLGGKGHLNRLVLSDDVTDTLPGTKGWMLVDQVANQTSPLINAITSRGYGGLGIHGFAVNNIHGTHASTNYAYLWDHSYMRQISGSGYDIGSWQN